MPVMRRPESLVPITTINDELRELAATHDPVTDAKRRYRLRCCPLLVVKDKAAILIGTDRHHLSGNIEPLLRRQDLCKSTGRG